MSNIHKITTSVVINNRRKASRVYMAADTTSKNIHIGLELVDGETEKVVEALNTEMTLTGAKRLRNALDAIIKVIQLTK